MEPGKFFFIVGLRRQKKWRKRSGKLRGIIADECYKLIIKASIINLSQLRIFSGPYCS